MRNNEYKIAFAGCKDTTYECISSLLEQKILVDLLITIDPDTAAKNNVAGYMDLREFAGNNNIEVYTADKYSLKSETDSKALGSVRIDLLFVIGWQRLIPEWLLEKISIGAFGMHGSSRHLPYGRGRSPMNWSIIQNRSLFVTNLFKYKKGVDDGEILDTQTFDLNEFDTAQTAHYKNTLSMIKLIRKNIHELINHKSPLKPQKDHPASYYPKRTEEDGCIFWDDKSSDIYNLVRAVTRPFPGAFTFCESNKIRIWRCYPFDTKLFDQNTAPGTVLHVFVNGDFVVKTGDGSIIVKEYEVPQGNWTVEKGCRLNSAGYTPKNSSLYPAEKLSGGAS